MASEDVLLKDMEIEGYIGIPLNYTNGNPLGLIVCMFKEPIKNQPFSESVIKLFSDRAVNEYERLVVQEQLILAKDKAEESDRLKSVFLQNMSHEIRTPLNAIMGFSDLLPSHFGNIPKLEYFAQIIQRRGNDLLELINDILDLSRIEAGQQHVNIEQCNINKLFEELNEIFDVYKKNKKKENIQLSFILNQDSRCVKIYTDPAKLKQILINLINNAIKFTDKGGIEIVCSFVNSTDVEFKVTDTGRGIPKDKQEIIFNRFMQLDNTTDNPIGGTGLGLAIVKGLVELLGGKIWVNSTSGVGSTFSFSISNALVCTLDELPKSTINLTSKKSLQNITVLIVEDDLLSAEFITEILSGNGMTLYHVVSGTELFSFFENNYADLILMDIQLSGTNDYDLTKQIKELRPEVKVIAQTAYTMADDKQKAMNAGCDDFISKPIKKELLLQKIKQVMELNPNSISKG